MFANKGSAWTPGAKKLCSLQFGRNHATYSLRDMGFVTITIITFSRQNPYRPMKFYTDGLQKTSEEKNAEFQDFMNSLLGPF